MTEHALYLESGPKRRKTMVHVLDLLGCVAQGPTTEDALENTPDAIRTFLGFLRRHGDAVNPEEPFTTSIAAHVMEGSWIGNGDPVTGFGPDFQPLGAEELIIHLRHLAWLHLDLLDLIRDIPPQQMVAEPEKGRSIFHILEHCAGAHAAYLRYTVGKVEGLLEASKAVERGPDDISASLARLWEISIKRTEAMTETERNQVVQHGQTAWTARRGLRRMLEHDWEHMMEIGRRLGGAE